MSTILSWLALLSGHCSRNLSVLTLGASSTVTLLVLNRAQPPALLWSLLALPALLVLIWPACRRKPFLLLLSAATLSFTLTNAHWHWLKSWHLTPEQENNLHLIEGVIGDVPVATEHGWRFALQLERWQGRPLHWWQSVRILLHCYQPECQPRAGERWRYQVKLKRPHASVNFFGFDYERYLFAHHVRATGSIRASADNKKLSNAASYDIDGWRADLQARITAADLSHGALLSGITLGLDDGISRADWQLLRRTGTVHLIAISGLHIVLVAAIVGGLAGLCWRLWPRAGLCLPAQKFAVLIGTLAALAYGALSGFSLPTVRAIIMASVLAFMLWRARKIDPLALLASVALVLIWCDPCALLVVGFWLSFASVAVLLLLARQRSAAKLSWWRTALHTQFWLSLALVPLSLWFFGQFSLLAPLANLIAVPFLGAILTPLALLAVLLLPVTPNLALALLQVVDSGCAWFMAIMTHLSGWPYASVSLPANTAAEALLLLATLVLLGSPRRSWRLAAGVGFLAAFGLYGLDYWRLSAKENAAAALTVLDVGQGLAISVETSAGVLVFDAGPRSARFDAGSDVLAVHLQAVGLATVDTAYISHADQDHAGGVLGLAAAIPVQHWRLGEPLAGIPGLPCRAGQSWRRGPVQAQVLWPLAEADILLNRSKRAAKSTGKPSRKVLNKAVTKVKANDRSCVLMLTIHGTKILLPGDIEQAAEGALVQHYGEQLRADIMLAPHHGSLSSSTPEFLQAVQARQVIVSAGYKHRHGHPKPAVLARYRALGSQVFNSADYGAVRLYWPSAGFEPRWQFARAGSSAWRQPIPSLPEQSAAMSPPGCILGVSGRYGRPAVVSPCAKVTPIFCRCRLIKV